MISTPLERPASPGLYGLTSNSRLFATQARPEATPVPTTAPTTTGSRPYPQDHAIDVLSARTQSNALPYLTLTLHHYQQLQSQEDE
jgi:hypothetical protein